MRSNSKFPAFMYSSSGHSIARSFSQPDRSRLSPGACSARRSRVFTAVPEMSSSSRLQKNPLSSKLFNRAQPRKEMLDTCLPSVNATCCNSTQPSRMTVLRLLALDRLGNAAAIADSASSVGSAVTRSLTRLSSLQAPVKDSRVLEDPSSYLR